MNPASWTGSIRSSWVERLRAAILPSPFQHSDGWGLTIAVLADCGLIVLGWLIVGACASLNTPRHDAYSLLTRTSLIGPWLAFGLLFSAMVTLLGYSEGLYPAGFGHVLGNWRRILPKSIGWATAGSVVAERLSGVANPGLRALGLGALLNLFCLALWRHWRLQAQRESGTRHFINVLIAGAGPTGRELARYLRQHPEQGRLVRGFLDNQNFPGFGVLGRFGDLTKVARSEFIDEVIVACPGNPNITKEIVQESRAQRLDVRLVPDLPISNWQDSWLEAWSGIPLLTLHRENQPSASLRIKRVIDLVLAGTGLFLLSPALLFIAALIRLDSRGTALYSAFRAGRKGRRFRCYKFRTMVEHADAAREHLRSANEREGPCFKLRDDPRITRIGRVLRRYSLDELPQLWNVMRGEMSLVGPRPHPLDDCLRYDLDHLRRLDVMPGMTGLWQISARDSRSFQTNMQLDLEYIERWSLGLDLRILGKTLGVVLRGTGT